MLQSLRKNLRGDLDAQACEILGQNCPFNPKKDPCGGYWEILQRKVYRPTNRARERERQTNDNKSFDLQKIKMKSDAFKENFSVKDNSTLAFAIFKILHFFI